jgi:hypothetical protein
MIGMLAAYKRVMLAELSDSGLYMKPLKMMTKDKGCLSFDG